MALLLRRLLNTDAMAERDILRCEKNGLCGWTPPRMADSAGM